MCLLSSTSPYFCLHVPALLPSGAEHRGKGSLTDVPPLPPSGAEYCGKGSLTDVLRGAKKDAAKAAALTWSRRLTMVRALRVWVGWAGWGRDGGPAWLVAWLGGQD